MLKELLSLIVIVCILNPIYAGQLPPQTPVIGIITQTHEDTPTKKSSYIAASYVKFLEMSGAQVVPILAFSETSTVLNLLSKINGVLFPGGGMEFSMDNQWTRNADAIFNYAKEQNDKGKVFPIFGTCLGFQLLSYLTAGHDNSVITRVHGDEAIVHPLEMTSQSSYLFEEFNERQLTQVTTGEGIFYYNHNYSITEQTFQKNGLLTSFWKLTSTSTTPQNEKFVASMEAKNYPFYAVQFHPEKNNFEWKVFAKRSKEAIEVVQIMSNKFVEKARQNTNNFIDTDEFMKASIYNYHTEFPTTMSFTQIYVFNEVPRKKMLLVQ